MPHDPTRAPCLLGGVKDQCPESSVLLLPTITGRPVTIYTTVKIFPVPVHCNENDSI